MEVTLAQNSSKLLSAISSTVGTILERVNTGRRSFLVPLESQGTCDLKSHRIEVPVKFIQLLFVE